MRLNVCFDLGYDTLKIVYAYKDSSRRVHFGKFNSTSINQSAIPSNAFYDEENNKWIFGNDIDLGANESFITVVKIKNLLALLQELDKEEKSIEKSNNNFYFRGHDFPKFYFPYHLVLNNKNDFQERKDNEMTFIVQDMTPQKLCEEYFRYVKNIMDEKIIKLVQDEQLDLKGIDYSIIYPSKVGDKYVDEFKRIIKLIFGEPKTVLSSIKAVSMYAYHLKYFKENESILFFDMGENDISVAKAKVIKDAEFNGVIIDAQDGHMLPIEIGGDNIDSAIVNYLEGTIERRETIGSPSFGEIGHIMEKGLHSKQYLLMKNVKKAKMILSKENYKYNLFENGVPITIVRDVIVQRNLTKEELKECIGITNNNGVARQIVDYILEEIKLKINTDVNKIIISGGLIETHGLFEYIESEIKKSYPNMEIYTLESKSELEEVYPIKSFEDSTFAACLGGVMVNLMKYQLKMCLARAYGTWQGVDGAGKSLQIFAEKGKVISNDGEFFSVSFTFSGDGITGEEFYSIDITQNQINRRENMKDVFLGGVKYHTFNNGSIALLIGEEPRKNDRGEYVARNEQEYMRVNASNLFGLKVVSGGADATVRYFYNGEMVRLEDKIWLSEGVIIDKHGYCKPHIQNFVERNLKDIPIYYLKYSRDSYGNILTDENGVKMVTRDENRRGIMVPGKDIVPAFEGLYDFGTQED